MLQGSSLHDEQSEVRWLQENSFGVDRMQTLQKYRVRALPPSDLKLLDEQLPRP